MLKKTIVIMPMILMLSLVSCIIETEEGHGNVMPGDTVPTFTVVMNNGKQLTTDSLRGKQSLIVFFNTDCPDCRRELPVLEEIYTRHKDYLQIVCISRSEDEKQVSGYWKEHELTLPYSAQTDSKVFDMFAKSGIPRIYVVNEFLIVTKIFTDNPLATVEEIENAINSTFASES